MLGPDLGTSCYSCTGLETLRAACLHVGLHLDVIKPEVNRCDRDGARHASSARSGGSEASWVAFLKVSNVLPWRTCANLCKSMQVEVDERLEDDRGAVGDDRMPRDRGIQLLDHRGE